MSPEVVSWTSQLCEILGLPQSTPAWVLSALSLAIIYSLIILPSGALMTYIERKLTADFQARIGPNRAGRGGMMQPFADAFKLLQKEAVLEWNWHEALWLAVHTMALYSTVAVIPLGSMALLVNTDMSALLPFWAALVLALGTMLLGFSQGTVPGWFGGVRVASQALAGAFPSLVALLCAGVRAGGFKWTVLAKSQGASPLNWAVMNPFLAIAFLVFVAGGMVLLSVSPMDAGLSVPDVHGGVSSQLHGRRLSLFLVGRFYGFFLWSVISVVIFLGAWNLPFGVAEKILEIGMPGLLSALELTWLLGKTFLLMMAVVSVARIVPRGRVDHITDFSWKVLSPFALFALIGSSLWIGLRGLL